MSSRQLLNFLEDWIASGASLSVQAQLLPVDVNCAVSVSSLSEGACQTPTEETAYTDFTDDSPTDQSDSSAREIIIAIATPLGVLLIVAASVVALVIIIKLSKRNKKDSKFDQQAVSSQK